jgi:hypothetical protein
MPSNRSFPPSAFARSQDCAAILEGLKQFSDAAEMYVKAEQYEKAAA